MRTICLGYQDGRCMVTFILLRQHHLRITSLPFLCPLDVFFPKKRFVSTTPRARSFYEVLGVPPTATSKEIKSAYYNLSKQYHPDLNRGADASNRFREVAEAYETLGNMDARRNYDRGLNVNSGRTDPYEVKNRYRETEMPGMRNFGNSAFRTAKRPGGMYTGKTEYYDFDEFYRQHYHEMKERQERIKQFYAYKSGAAETRNAAQQARFHEKQNDTALSVIMGFFLLLLALSYIIEAEQHASYSERDRRVVASDPYYHVREQVRNFHSLDPLGRVYRTREPRMEYEPVTRVTEKTVVEERKPEQSDGSPGKL